MRRGASKYFLLLLLIINASIHTSLQSPLDCMLARASDGASYAVSDDPYLVNNETMKVLRVPYLHQDLVNECWLYSAGMIVAYYVGDFDPDVVLNKLGKGFDAEFNILLEHGEFKKVLKDVYGIKLSIDLLQPIFLSERELMDLVVSEISNARPLLFMASARLSGKKVGHVIVITGYYVNASGFYIVVNDPSGAFTHDIWGATRRFDGSFAEPMSAYGVLVDLKRVWNTTTCRFVVTVEEGPSKPNPPEAVVYAYTWKPYATTTPYDSLRRSCEKWSTTHFYHNNYLDKSLWYPIPIIKVQEPVDFTIWVYPNTLQPKELNLYVGVTHEDVHGFVVSATDKLSVKIHNYSYAEIISPGRTLFNYYPSGQTSSIDLSIYPWSAGIMQVRLTLIDEAASSSVFEWGPVELYVYHETSRLCVEKSECKVDVVAGILYDDPHEKKIVDLYVAFSSPALLEFPIYTPLCTFKLIRPSHHLFTKAQPHKTLGGYYYTYRMEIPKDQNSISIEGVINCTLARSIPVNEVLLLPESGISKAGLVDLKEVVFYKNGSATLHISYLITRHISSSYSLFVEAGTSRGSVDLGASLSGDVVHNVIVPNGQVIPITLGVVSGIGGYIFDVVSVKVVNPLSASISELSMPAQIVEGGYTFIRYNVSLPKAAMDSLSDISMSSVVYINGSEARSTTWVERVIWEGDKVVLLMRSAVYVRPREVSDTVEYAYEFTVIPKLGIKYRADSVAYAYSYDLNSTKIVTVYKKDREVGRVASVLVIDVSGSMGSIFKGRSKLDWAKEAAICLVNLTLDGDRLGLIAFSSRPKLVQDVVVVNSSVREDIIQKIKGLSEGGSTNIGDSLKLATDLLSRRELREYKKAVILLTDGMHNTGTHPLEVLGYVKEMDVKVYTVGLGEPGDIDEEVLNRIAYETGGLYFYAPTPDKLQEIFNHIRGEVAALNLIDLDVVRLGPSQEVWRIYPLDLSYSDFIIEISWDAGLEPVIRLQLLNLTVDQRNASLIGIEVTRPVRNTLRFRFPRGSNTIFLAETIPVNVTISNINRNDILVKISVFGGKEQLLEVVLDNPTARYLKGQYLFFRSVVEEGKKTQVMLLDNDGAVLYYNVLAVRDASGVWSGTLNHFIRLPGIPGTYYLKTTLFGSFQLKTRIMSIVVVDTPYRDPIVVSHAKKVKGFGLIKIPINISVQEPGILGKRLIIQAKLEPEKPYAPSISVEKEMIEIENLIEENYMFVSIPFNAMPGTYNVSLLFYIDGHSFLVKEDAMEIRVPSIDVGVVDFERVVCTRQGDLVHSKVTLNIIGDDKYAVDLELVPRFEDERAFIEGQLRSYKATVYTNSSITASIEYDASKVGVYLGLISISMNGTPINNLAQTLVVIPPISDVARTIWAYRYDVLTLGPDLTKGIEAQLKISGKTKVAGIISVPVNTKSSIDYVVYAHGGDEVAMSMLTVLIPQEMRSQEYVLYVEKDGVVIDVIGLTEQSDKVFIAVEPEHVYRVWIELTSPPLIIGGGGGRPPKTTTPSEAQPPIVSWLPMVVALVATAVAVELSVIALLYLRRRRAALS